MRSPGAAWHTSYASFFEWADSLVFECFFVGDDTGEEI